MRLLLQYCNDMLMHKHTLRLDLTPHCRNTDDLLQLVESAIRKSRSGFVLRVRRDGVWLRVIESRLLQAYELQAGMVLQLQFVGNQYEQDFKISNNNKKKKILGQFSAERAKTVRVEPQPSVLPKFSTDSYFDQQLLRAQALARQGNLSDFQILLQSVPQEANYEEDNLIRLKKKQIILNQLGSNGWSVAHEAVFSNQILFVLHLLKINASFTLVSSDNETCLQIASKKQHLDIIQILIAGECCDINEITSHGSALHVAAKYGKCQSIKALIDLGADRQIKSDKGLKAQDVCMDMACKSLLRTYVTERKEQSAQTAVKLVKGTIFKLTFTKQLKQRYILINPTEGSFVRYESQQQYPLKPTQVIRLIDIVSVDMVPFQSYSFFMKKDYFFIELKFAKSQFYASKSQLLAKEWVLRLKQAVSFCKKNRQLPIEIPVITIRQDQAQIKQKQINKKLSKQDELKILIEKTLRQRAPCPSPGLKSKQRTVTTNNSSSQTKKAQERQQEQENQQPRSVIQLRQAPVQIQLPKKQSAKFSDFQLRRLLGKGSFGKVFEVVHLKTNKIFAMKALNKKVLIVKRQLKYAVAECNILKSINNPFVVQLHYAFQTPNYLYLVMDYCKKGDISYFLACKGTFSQDQARFYIAQLILSIQYLHNCNIIYRDLKPNNMLITVEGQMKLADFGLAKEGVRNQDKTLSFCGTQSYVSPQMLAMKGTGKEADNYGIGAVLYQFLHGQPPYMAQTIQQLRHNIINGKLRFDRKLSESAKLLIAGLLQRTPKKRLGYRSKDEIKNHLFFKGFDWKKLQRGEIEAPLKYFQIQDEEDLVRNPKFTDFDYDAENMRINRVFNFSFTR